MSGSISAATRQSTVHLYPVDGAVHCVRLWSIVDLEAPHPYPAGGTYVNMVMDGREDRVRASYRGNHSRFVAIKAAYDPASLSRVNQNIRPANTAAREYWSPHPTCRPG